MNKLCFITVFFLIANTLLCQELVVGKVTDKNTGDPLAFANIVFNENQFLGARSDIDGKYSFSIPEKIKTLTCTYIGYKKKTINIDTLSKSRRVIIIELEPLTTELQEVVVKPGDNPANLIIKKVIMNKEINDPEKYLSFRYTSYNKVIYDFLYNNKAKADSIKISNKLGGSHLLIMESVTERKYLKPDFSEETVIGTKVSGFKNPSFVTLATDLQPFSFYYDNVKLFDRNYLNPISNRGTDSYRFIIEDTLFQNNDTTYVISFKPKPRKNFDGLTGLLYINTRKYAIENVVASPYEKGKIDLRIQQQYSFLENKYWFPEQLNYVLTLREYPSKEIGLIANGSSYIDSVEFNIPIDRQYFSTEYIKIDKHASKRDSLFWETHRKEILNAREKTTYRVIDSLGEKKKFGRALLVIEKLSQLKIPVKYIDIDVTKSLISNKYEGYRPGFGFYTNEKLSGRITFGGFFGYGIKDNRWKYGGEVNCLISQKNELKIGFKQQKNVIETGASGIKYFNENILDLRSYIAYQMDDIFQNSLNIAFRAFRYTTWMISLNNTQTTPEYLYQFQNNNQTVYRYTNSDLSVNLKFAYKEKIMNSLNQKISMGTKYPTIYLSWSRGFRNLWGSNFEYNKLETRVDQIFFINKFGTTKYRLEGGFADRSLPYGLLFTGEGSFDGKYPNNISNTFQTMTPYEFLSDRYVNLFLSHNFGPLLFHIRKFAPNISIHNNIGWGTLANSDFHKLINFRTKEKGYFETGIQFDNIIKINYLNVGYIGLGTGAYCRYGYYSFPDFKNNLAFKITMTYTLK